MATQHYKVRVPWFQPLSVVRGVLKVYDGVFPAVIKEYIQTIRDLTGTPQQTLDWSDPNEWISQRLDGEMARLYK